MGGTFTPDDIKSFLISNGTETRASNKNGITYSLRRNGDVDPQFYTDYYKVVGQNAPSILAEINTLDVSKKEADRILGERMTEVLNPWFMENAHKYNLIYTIEQKRY